MQLSLIRSSAFLSSYQTQRMCELFEETVAPMLTQVGNLMQQNQKLRAARDLLLPRLMSGEITG